MNEHTRSILDRMLSIISDYRVKKISLRNLVDSLEGSLNAIEEKLPSKFMDSWYEYWGDLEIILSSKEMKADSYDNETLVALNELESNISNYLLNN
jgi:hypothetical protein